MLPFLKKQHESGVAGPVETVKREPDQESEPDSLEVAMQELFSAKSDKERAAAFRAAFDLLETQPHDEVSHG
jgi:hypothetical protein